MISSRQQQTNQGQHLKHPLISMALFSLTAVLVCQHAYTRRMSNKDGLIVSVTHCHCCNETCEKTNTIEQTTTTTTIQRVRINSEGQKMTQRIGVNSRIPANCVGDYFLHWQLLDIFLILLSVVSIGSGLFLHLLVQREIEARTPPLRYK